jgi:hypothetical protein
MEVSTRASAEPPVESGPGARWLRWSGVIGTVVLSALSTAVAPGANGDPITAGAEGVGYAAAQLAILLGLALLIGRGMAPNRRWIAWTIGGVFPCFLAGVRLAEAEQGRAEWASGLKELRAAAESPDSAPRMARENDNFGRIMITHQRSLATAMAPYQQAVALLSDTAWTRLFGSADGRVELRVRLTQARKALAQARVDIDSSMAGTRQRLVTLAARNPVFTGAAGGFDRGAAQAQGTLGVMLSNEHGTLQVMDSMVQVVDQYAVRMGPTGPLFASDAQVAEYNALYARLTRHAAIGDSLRGATLESQARFKASLDSAIQAEGASGR